MQCLKNKDGYNKGYLLKDDAFVLKDDIPLSEHPNPQFQRSSYYCLNGLWDFKRSKKDELPSSYEKKIRVPFAVETIDSGINELVSPDDFLYYHRIVGLPKDFTKEKVLIHFEGVDQICSVYVNGQLLLTHEGGRMPFVLELSSAVFPIDIILKVKDVTDSLYYTNGKQTLDPSGWKYSSSSGVYKPIWMENVPLSYLEGVSFTEEIENHGVRVKVLSSREGTCKIRIRNEEYEAEIGKETFLELKDTLHLWNREDPFLYTAVLSFKGDTVYTYFGLRKREIKEQNGFKRLYLNGKPLFLSGLLDQGYYSSSRLTPSSYSDYLNDIEKTKKLGFNCLRIHRKTEIPYFYYLADRYGRLLIQDFPCGGYSPSFFSVVLPRLFPFLSKEKHLDSDKTGRKNGASIALFEEERKEFIPFFHNHPSIIRETIFNEGWGETKPSYFYDLAKKLDPKRLFDTASGWYEADRSDVFSIHTYTIPYRKRKNRFKRLFLLTEIGGIGLKPSSFPYPKRFGHKNAKDKEDLEAKRIDLYHNRICPQIKDFGLSGVIYTQLSDCEEEANGLFDYRHEEQKIDTDTVYKLNKELYDAFNALRR